MEIVLSLQAVPGTDWIQQLAERAGEHGITIDATRRPAGTWGAGWTPKARAVLSDVADAAQVIGLAIALYTIQPAKPQNCEIDFANGDTHVQLVVPCATTQGPQFAHEVAVALSKLPAGRPEVTIKPAGTAPAQ